MEWAERLEVSRFGFKPLKHRRFRFDVEALERLHHVTDDRLAMASPSVLAGSNGPGVVDVHSFHTSTVKAAIGNIPSS